jgi:hypothetical protein
MEWLSGRRITVWIMLTAVASCALAAGCGNGQEDRVRTYAQDGYMGYTNTNPNLPGRNMALTYETDGDMVGQVLAPLRGIKSKQVLINGSAMNVNIKVDSQLSDAEITKLRRDAQAVVQYNMPRYIVHVDAKRE